MEIAEIKTQLTLAQVLQHYNLKPDKHHKLNCPFHEDKTPSFQVYYKTHTCYCFSSNCKTYGKSLDVIDFIMYKENSTKHEAIEKAKQLIGGTAINTKPAAPLTRIAILTKMFAYFKNAMHSSPPAKEYMKSRNLDHTQTEIGYNTAQFHHGTRKDEALIESCLQIGLLYEYGTNSRVGGKSYGAFGKYGIVFPLKNKSGQIVSLYFRSTVNDDKAKHYYLKDRQGLYPCYPDSSTTKLILTEAIIDAATLLQIEELRKNYSILSLYGTNGFTDEHKEAIKALKNVNEIVFAFDNDEAGKEAMKKYTEELKTQYPHITITALSLPENEDVNSTAQAHNLEIFTHLLETRTPFIFSTEKETSANPTTTEQTTIPLEKEKPKPTVQQETLNAENPYNIIYKGKAADYYIKGGLRGHLDSLKISIQIVQRENRLDIRAKADLYENKQAETLVKTASEKLGIESHQLEKDISTLTHLLEAHRNTTLQERKNKNLKTVVKLPDATITECIKFLEKPKLIHNINELIGKAGVTGEDKNRLCLFAIASSYKMPDTLHALIQGSSGSGKTRLLKIINELMPGEETIKFTRVTDSSFYNYPENYLINKLICFEDIDGLKEDALYAVRELISNEILVSSTTTKTEDGQIMAAERTVRGPIASISCTTKGAIYEDNMSRVFLIAVDESKEQTKKIIKYQQQRASGLIDHEKENKVKEFLQNCIRVLKPHQVINPYAGKIQLPEEAHKIRRLNDLYLSFVKQVTLLNQYQRKKDDKGRLISTIEDLQTANDIMFESILLKVDELDGSLRQFYEALKAYVKKKNEDNSFILREVRQTLNISKTQLHRYITDLTQLEYIQQVGGFSNKGFKYKLLYWDNIEALRAKIKTQLQKQIEQLPTENKPVFQHNGTLNGTLHAL